jgi:hypothetical protein
MLMVAGAAALTAEVAEMVVVLAAVVVVAEVERGVLATAEVAGLVAVKVMVAEVERGVLTTAEVTGVVVVVVAKAEHGVVPPTEVVAAEVAGTEHGVVPPTEVAGVVACRGVVRLKGARRWAVKAGVPTAVEGRATRGLVAPLWQHIHAPRQRRLCKTVQLSVLAPPCALRGSACSVSVKGCCTASSSQTPLRTPARSTGLFLSPTHRCA